VCDGEPLKAQAAELLHPTRQNAWIAISLDQGRYRQVRRMCEAVGHPVLKLVRVAVGPIHLGSLGRGEWRPLTAAELGELRSRVPGASPPGPEGR
jgi:23S rRNA pseudouridine2605 synthase